MKRRILLTTDFSDNAQNAIDYAINLYKNDNCDFYILNTYHAEAFTMELAAVGNLEEAKQISTERLAYILDRISAVDTSENHRYHLVSQHGTLIETMKELIDKHDIDVVVMGTKGDTDSRTKIYGSHTVLAMERIRNCPVLAVPAGAVYKGIKEIVFPTGYRTPYKRREFQYLVDIAKNTGAAIRVLHVLDKDKQLDEDQLGKQNLLKDYFEGLEYSFHLAYDTEVQLALDSFIQRYNSDLVAFINKKHNFLTWMLSKPMVKNLTYYSTIPVLALHDLRN